MEQENKPHRKGKTKKAATSNPKAFAFANPGRHAKQVARSHDLKEKRLQVPLVDRLPEEAPPLIVGVVGPPGVGKTTLVKSLIRRYAKQTLSAPTGPLTVVTSKRRRLTLIECPSYSVTAMIDVAKVVDIVLLMIDGKYGFEMETMEFLNVLSASGMPGNVFGILTKLDLFTKQETLRAQKKRLKHRFWSELHQGAKLFYLSGVVNGRYPDREVHNLSRFLSVMKNPRPLVWRNSHPYCLADRFLDITPPTSIEDNAKCDRTIALYGYLRGTNFPAHSARVHIPGLGDVNVSEIEALPDPCPTPFQKLAAEKMSGKKGKTRLGEKQKILFAPMSDVGGVLVDKDAVYIDVKTSTFDQDSTEKGLGEQMVMALHGGRRAEDANVRLFGDGEVVERRPVDDVEVEFDNDADSEDSASVSSDFSMASDTATYWRIEDLSRMMYNVKMSPGQVVQAWTGQSVEERQTDGDEFFTQKSATLAEDRMTPIYDYEELTLHWQDAVNAKRLLQRCIVASADVVDSSDGDGDFEDLEEDLETERARNARKKEQLKARFEEEDRDGFNKAVARQEDEFGEDEWFDAQKARIQRQLDINRQEFEDMDDASRIRVEGHRAGTYARIVLTDVPYEFCASFDPRVPLIIGGLNATEERFGFVQVRIKRHRWFPKILKTNDPLIFSLGWRRFQSLPIYSISDSRTRNRMLKYTPEHMHCFGTFYGPLIAPNTGFCAIQTLQKVSNFRIAATGVVLDVDESVEIVKKLKLKGYPHKIFKNTAIIKDMFASELEAAKFKAAGLRTVSGVRGMIKGRAGAQFPDGYVRAGFEDKILMSDIVFLSTWRAITPAEFYAPVTNLLSNDWTGMRLTSAVRAEQNLPTPSNANSQYRQIERSERHFNPLRVPRKLAAELPFKSQISQMAPARKPTYVSRRAVVLGGEEKRARDLMQKVMTVRNEKMAKRRTAQQKRREPFQKKLADLEEKRVERQKEESREYWRREGRKRKTDGAESGSKRRKG